MNYLQKALLWALVATAFLLGVFIAEVTRVEATTTDGYCRIGADPVNPGLLLEGEKIYKLPQDLRAKIGSKSGKISDCVLKAGEELVISETSTGIWRVVRIYSCGNPVLSEMYAEISQAPTPMPHTNLRPLQAPQQQAPPQQSAPTTLSQTTNVMVQAPSTPTGPPINVSHYENGNGGSYNPNSAYDNY
ncbi:MAG: hypothetical protein Q7K40_00005, partial [bacterium]|nr:hypothetical protein [bacterium]